VILSSEIDMTSHHYSDDVRDTELDEDYVVAPHVCAIEADYNFRCNICKIRLARIFQEEENYCLKCWQERMHPSL